MANDNQSLRHLSLLELQSLIQNSDEANLHVYVDQNVGVVKNFFHDIADNIKGHPITFSEMRVLIVKRGWSRATINLLPVEIKANTLTFLSKNSTIEVKEFSDDADVMGFTITDELFLLAMGSLIPASLDGHLRDFQLDLSDEEMSFISRLIDLLYESTRKNDYSSHVFLSLAASFWWYVDTLYNQKQQVLTSSGNRNQELFSRFIALVNQHVRQQHSLEFYADHLFLSQRYMGTLVKQVSGKSAKEWIDEALVTAIKVDLRHTTKPLKQIAEEMNFANMSFFSKYFKRMTGQTPMEYRNQKIIS